MNFVIQQKVIESHQFYAWKHFLLKWYNRMKIMVTVYTNKRQCIKQHYYLNNNDNDIKTKTNSHG